MGKSLLTKAIGVIGAHSSWNFFRILCRGEVHNLHYIKQLEKAPFIVAPNHTSHMDWLVLHSLFSKKLDQQIVFLAKKELFESGFWSRPMDYGKSIRLDRDNVTKDVLKSIYASVKLNEVIGIFPEGTRSPDGKIIEAKNGAAKLALITKLPVVPIGLSGFYDVLPKGNKIPIPHKCKINIGRPIYLSKDYRDLSLDEMTNMIMKEIAKLSGQEYNFSHNKV